MLEDCALQTAVCQAHIELKICVSATCHVRWAIAYSLAHCGGSLTRLLHQQDGDEGVALESCEFWTAFCEAQVEPAVLRPFLGRLVPVLLKNMVYGEYDEEVQDAEAAEDANQAEDKDQEIKPFISRQDCSVLDPTSWKVFVSIAAKASGK